MKHLRDVLDRKNYARLINVFGGTRLWIPKSGNLGHRERKYFVYRNRKIKKLRKNGYRVERLSALFNLSPKRIYSIVGSHAPAARKRGHQTH